MSESSIPISLEGLANITSELTRVEERIQRVITTYYTSADFNDNDANKKSHLYIKYLIPNHMTWIVTMWYFGQDSLIGYTGERFEISWKEGLKVFRIYSKEYRHKKMKIRKETQEYPKKVTRRLHLYTKFEESHLEKISTT